MSETPVRQAWNKVHDKWGDAVVDAEIVDFAIRAAVAAERERCAGELETDKKALLAAMTRIANGETNDPRGFAAVVLMDGMVQEAHDEL